MADRVTLADIDQGARDSLASLGRHDIHLLSIEAQNEEERIEEATWPRDPEAALGAFWETATRRPPNPELDDQFAEVERSLRVAVLILSHVRDLDEDDCEALAWILGRAEGLIGWERRNRAELVRRLHRIVKRP